MFALLLTIVAPALSDIDIKKNAEAVADLFVSFFEQFVDILTRPRHAITNIFYSESTIRKRLQTSIVFSISSVSLGIAFARFVELPGSPTGVNPETAVAVLLVWVFSAMTLHPILKVFGARGGLHDTIVVFLLIVSSLHLVFIPFLSAASHAVTDTEVTLTYDYVVYFGWPTKQREYEYGDISRRLRDHWRSTLEGEHTETFIKEKEPERDRTILPPAPNLDEIEEFSDVPTSPESVKRIGASDTPYNKPHRTEQLVLASDLFYVVFGIWVVYYLTHSVYLAAGLSVPHKIKPGVLLVLAFAGPIFLAVFLAVLGVVFILCRDFFGLYA